MAFLSSVQQWIAKYVPGSPERIILEFLQRNGAGRQNAQPWAAIEAELSRHGYDWRLQTFQQGLLKQSREAELYIGSNDHGEFRGYFLIADQEDAELMANWYRRRIAVEQTRLDNLEALIQQEWP